MSADGVQRGKRTALISVLEWARVIADTNSNANNVIDQRYDEHLLPVTHSVTRLAERDECNGSQHQLLLDCRIVVTLMITPVSV